MKAWVTSCEEGYQGGEEQELSVLRLGQCGMGDSCVNKTPGLRVTRPGHSRDG